VHAPGIGAPSSAEQCYLEVELQDGWCGFVPLVCSTVAREPDCARLLATVDLYLPSAHAVINRHVAPFLGNIAAADIGPAAGATLAWPMLIVAPLNTVAPPRALLSHLLAHPLEPDEGLLFICSAAWTDPDVAALEDLARFYVGNRATIRRTEAVATIRTALTIAATRSTADHILLLADGATGTAPGWRRALQKAAVDGAAGFVSPTILYEDKSIRYAGAGELEPTETAPFIRLRRPLAGLPTNFAPAGPAVQTAGISTACCLITREALDSLARLPTAVIAAHWAPEFDLLRQVQSSGIACLWTPAVQVYAPDVAPDETPLARARAAIGRWSIRAALTAMGD
jgi:hypothetical protein